MKTQSILFIQGAGEGAYVEDKKLVTALEKLLGDAYTIIYPTMPDEGNVLYEEWTNRIQKELEEIQDPVIIIGHSVGGSIIAKFLSEVELKNSASAVFLLASPFWGGNGWKYEGYKELQLYQDLASKFSDKTKLFLYHCEDDEVVPISHLDLYAQIFPNATVRKCATGGHQLTGNVAALAKDISNL